MNSPAEPQLVGQWRSTGTALIYPRESGPKFLDPGHQGPYPLPLPGDSESQSSPARSLRGPPLRLAVTLETAVAC